MCIVMLLGIDLESHLYLCIFVWLSISSTAMDVMDAMDAQVVLAVLPSVRPGVCRVLCVEVRFKIIFKNVCCNALLFEMSVGCFPVVMSFCF